MSRALSRERHSAGAKRRCEAVGRRPAAADAEPRGAMK
jgi:hypothetical protein